MLPDPVQSRNAAAMGRPMRIHPLQKARGEAVPVRSARQMWAAKPYFIPKRCACFAIRDVGHGRLSGAAQAMTPGRDAGSTLLGRGLAPL